VVRITPIVVPVVIAAVLVRFRTVALADQVDGARGLHLRST
jgi:hypothetical protein